MRWTLKKRLCSKTMMEKKDLNRSGKLIKALFNIKVNKSIHCFQTFFKGFFQLNFCDFLLFFYTSEIKRFLLDF